jgi:hypothetical protein
MKLKLTDLLMFVLGFHSIVMLLLWLGDMHGLDF